MSSLNEPIEELEREAIAALEGEGFAYNPLTTHFSKYLAVCLGEPTAYKRKTITRMLAELNSDLGGSTVSYLTRSYADLLDTLETTIGGGGGGDPILPAGATALYDFKNGVYNNGTVLALSDVLGDSTIFSGTFDPDRVIAGTGLTGSAVTISLIDDALATAQPPMAIVAQVTLAANVSVQFEYCTDDFATDIVATVTTIGAGTTQIADANIDATLSGSNPSSGMSKFGYTVAASGMIAALNGTLLTVPPEEISNPPQLNGGPLDEVAITIAEGAVIERIVIYPVKNGTELQALTA